MLSLVIVVMYMSLFAGLEKSSIFYPVRDWAATPRDAGLAYEDVYLRTQDGVTIHGWFVPRERAGGVVLHCHGNAGNVSHRIHLLKMFYESGFSTFIFDYRGYGRSGGSPDEDGTYLDAMAAFQYLVETKGYAAGRIAVHGQSLGGAVAIELATRTQPAALICESVFTSTLDMARELYPILPVQWFISMKYDSLSKIGSLTLPKLFMHSREDEIVGFQHGERLFSAAGDPKEFFEMQGGHNDGFLMTPDYAQVIEEFLKRVLKS